MHRQILPNPRPSQIFRNSCLRRFCVCGFCVCGFSTVQNSSGALFEDFHVTHEHPRHAHRASTVRYLKLGGTRSSAVPTRLASCRRGSTARQRPTSAPASPRTAPEAALAALATAWLPRVTPELVRETSKPLRRNLRAQNLQAPRKSKICGHKNLRVRKICRSSDVVSTHAKSAGGKICPGSGFGNIYGASVLKLCVAFCAVLVVF